MSRLDAQDWERDLSQPPLRDGGYSPDLLEGVKKRLPRKRRFHPWRRLLPLMSGFGAVAVAAVLLFALRPPTLDRSTMPSDPKEQIVWKMYHTSDLFQTARGKIEQTHREGGVTIIDFAIREGEQPACWELAYGGGAGNQTTERIAISGYELTKRDGAILDAGRVAPYVPNNSNHYQSRAQDPANSALSQAVVNPTTETPNFLEVTHNWEIVGTETLLERPVTVLTGQLSDYLQSKLHATTFKMWIDQGNGLLLKRVLYDATGSIVEQVKVKELQVDTPIPEKTFQLDTALVDRRQAQHSYEAVHQASSGLVDDKSIPAELHDRWEQAKQQSTTVVFPSGHAYYIYPRAEYMIDSVSVANSIATVRLVHTDDPKASVPYMLLNYPVEDVRIDER